MFWLFFYFCYEMRKNCLSMNAKSVLIVICLHVLFMRTKVFCFNIEDRDPKVKKAPEDQKNAYFGFSVALHQTMANSVSTADNWWVFNKTTLPVLFKWKVIGLLLGFPNVGHFDLLIILLFSSIFMYFVIFWSQILKLLDIVHSLSFLFAIMQTYLEKPRLLQNFYKKKRISKYYAN